MEFSELEKKIRDAIFLTARQKTALLAVLPTMSDNKQRELDTFLTQTPKKLGKRVVEQDKKRVELLKQFANGLRNIEHHAAQEVWHEAENLDKAKEESSLENLLNKL